jgi:hypothetical protein
MEAAVDSLTPQGGPGFLIVEGTAQNYAQAAGGDGRFTAEWREDSGGGFKHGVAGLAGVADEEIVEIDTNGSFVAVRANEVRAREDIKSIFSAFAHSTGRPSKYVWRDVTATLV